MSQIPARMNLQERAVLKEGRVDWHWYENKRTGLKRTLFHRIIIPLEPIDTLLDTFQQPQETELCFDWISLKLKVPAGLNGVKISRDTHPDMEGSIYIWSSHHPIDVEEMNISLIGKNRFKIIAKTMIDFQFESELENERLDFEATIILDGSEYPQNSKLPRRRKLGAWLKTVLSKKSR